MTFEKGSSIEEAETLSGLAGVICCDFLAHEGSISIPFGKTKVLMRLRKVSSKRSLSSLELPEDPKEIILRLLVIAYLAVFYEMRVKEGINSLMS